MSVARSDIVFREPRLLYVLFLVFSVGLAVLVYLGLSGGAKYALLVALALFAIWTISNILRPRWFAEIRDGRFKIVNTETWKTDVFAISQLQQVSLEPSAKMGAGGPEGGVNLQHRLTLHLRDGSDVSYLLPHRASICEEIARQLNLRATASPEAPRK